MKKYTLFLSSLSVVGCAWITPKVEMDVVVQDKLNFSSEVAPDSYPGYMTAAGNIYSCRFGIYHKGRKEFNPPKEDIFYSLLVENNSKIKGASIVLKRFDIYYNQRLSALSVAGGAIGGIIGSSITESANATNYGFVDKNLLIYTIPSDYPKETNENAVGCDDKRDGEYYPSNITAGHNVVVGWYHFSVNQDEYHYRTTYQVQPTNRIEIQQAYSKAIKASLSAISQKIKYNE